MIGMEFATSRLFRSQFELVEESGFSHMDVVDCFASALLDLGQTFEKRNAPLLLDH